MSDIISELETISAHSEKIFGNLSGEQINWKPDADEWSVGQCFEHLIKANELFFEELDKIAEGTRKNSFLEKFSPLSGLLGSLLINSLKKDARKIKAPTKRIAPTSEVDPNVIEIFAAHQAELNEKIKRTEAVDWNKIKVTSPYLKIVTYTLHDGFQIIVEHEKRHVRQAERVLRESNFPK